VSLASNIIDRLGLTGTAATSLREAIDSAENSKKAASVIGLAGLAWSALGVVQAIQLAVDRPWQVKAGGVVNRFRSFGYLVLTGAFVAASTAATAFVFAALPGWAAPFTIVASTVINVVMFWFMFVAIGNQKVGWRPLIPGAVVAGIGLQVLTVAGAIIVPRSVASSSALYGSMGVVFAILAWLFFFGRLLVYSSTLNVVLYERDRGTVTLEVEAPRMPGEVPLGATRAGVVVETVSS
jgi:membrane protein